MQSVSHSFSQVNKILLDNFKKVLSHDDCHAMRGAFLFFGSLISGKNKSCFGRICEVASTDYGGLFAHLVVFRECPITPEWHTQGAEANIWGWILRMIADKIYKSAKF